MVSRGFHCGRCSISGWFLHFIDWMVRSEVCQHFDLVFSQYQRGLTLFSGVARTRRGGWWMRWGWKTWRRKKDAALGLNWREIDQLMPRLWDYREILVAHFGFSTGTNWSICHLVQESTFSTKQLQFWGGEFYGHFSAFFPQCIENSAKLSLIKAASSFVCNTKSPSPSVLVFLPPRARSCPTPNGVEQFQILVVH